MLSFWQTNYITFKFTRSKKRGTIADRLLLIVNLEQIKDARFWRDFCRWSGQRKFRSRKWSLVEIRESIFKVSKKYRKLVLLHFLKVIRATKYTSGGWPYRRNELAKEYFVDRQVRSSTKNEDKIVEDATFEPTFWWYQGRVFRFLGRKWFKTILKLLTGSKSYFDCSRFSNNSSFGRNKYYFLSPWKSNLQRIHPVLDFSPWWIVSFSIRDIIRWIFSTRNAVYI